MTTRELFVIDTNTVIYYFHDVFHVKNQVSRQIDQIFKIALSNNDERVKISIPSIVFVEIYEKWLRCEEISRQFYYEVYLPIKASPNIEIKPLDKEVLEELLDIDGPLRNHDLHDKIVLASAISLKCRLISTDTKLIQFVNTTRVIPEVIS